MKHVYIAVSGGVVQGVRIEAPAGEYTCTVVDYDDFEADEEKYGFDEQDFERERLDGKTWSELDECSVGIY
jgi:hypothetical protein